MKTTIWAAAITGAMLLAGAGTAQAKVVRETFSSTINSGFDLQGRFGAISNDLVGKSIQVQFTFDIGSGGIVQLYGNYTGIYREGSFYKTANTAKTVVMINGVTREFHTGYLGLIDNERQSQSQDSINVATHQNDLAIANDEALGAVQSMNDDFLKSIDIGFPIEFTASNVYTLVAARDYNGFYADSGRAPVRIIVSSVPEPAALALLGLGAALLAAARRQG